MRRNLCRAGIAGKGTRYSPGLHDGQDHPGPDRRLYKKDHEGVENVIVDVNEEKKDLRMYVQKENRRRWKTQAPRSLWRTPGPCPPSISWAAVNIPVKNVEFGRIAAGNGKQVIIQGLREAEHGMIYDEWGSKEHEILTGTVHRIDPRGTVHLRIGSGNEATEGLMGSNEQVPRRGALPRGSPGEGLPGGGPPHHPGVPR